MLKQLNQVKALRYVNALRAGGSVPGIVETDDLGTYVVKFTGAAQGRKALVAEVVVGELARRLGLRVPELVLVDFDPAVAAQEEDAEIQDLLRASAGINLGMDYLPGARDFRPAPTDAVRPQRPAQTRAQPSTRSPVQPPAQPVEIDPLEAGRVIWLDALTANVDRTRSNPNLMVWHRRLWLIDNGAALVFHHRWSGAADAVAKAYDFSGHALGGYHPDVAAADAELAPLVTEPLLREVLALVPDAWLADEPGFADVDALRAAYVQHLAARAALSRHWLPRDFATDEQLRATEAARIAKAQAGRPAWLQHVPDLHGPK
ncbi:HipA family kinase [Kitasatospora mediocidica]|uniref:HipA family kinase n=1 Tax=Kitasatospora mediocidica TaxID=58352 RepID=UPI001E61FFC0|nr:HipA family kinase [Kitasatospora mediocidica]